MKQFSGFMSDFSSNIMDGAGEFMDNIWEFTSNDLPDIITDFISNMKEMILGLKEKMAEKIAQIIQFLQDKVGPFVSKIKGVAVDSYESFLARVINPIVQFFVNKLINTTVKMFMKIKEFRDLVWKTLSDAVDKFTGLEVFDFATDIVDVFQKIPGVFDSMKESVVDLVNKLKRGVIGSLNKGINSSSAFIEVIANGVLCDTNKLIKTSEDLVNKLSDGLNDSMNKVENKVNDVTKTMGGVVNRAVGTVNRVTGTLTSLRGKKILRVKPFGFIPTIPRIPGVSIPPLNIRDIPDADFGEIKTNLEIPDVDIKGPGDLTVDDLGINVSIPGFGFITKRIEQIKTAVQDIFEKAMAPLYSGASALIALVSTIIAGATQLFHDYLSWTAIKSHISQLTALAGAGVEKLKAFFVDDIIPAFIALINTTKESILDFVGKVTTFAWKFMSKLGGSVATLFKTAFQAITKITGKVAKGVLSTAWFIVGTTVDRYTGVIPVPLSVKLIGVILTVV